MAAVHKAAKKGGEKLGPRLADLEGFLLHMTIL